MPDRYSSGRDPRRNSTERPVRSASHPNGTYRSNGAARTSRPAGSQPQGRRPAPRRRKKRAQPRLFIFAAILVVIVVVALILILGGGKGGEVTQPQPTPTPAANSSAMSNATISTREADATDALTEDSAAENSTSEDSTSENSTSEDSGSSSSLAQLLGDEDAELSALSEEDRVSISDLSINTSLPDTWLNVLLLGTDERTYNESARTDTMIICSINTSTAEVKLTSIMRDLAVDYDDLGKYNGTYRINAANYFGGPEYAMKTVNECFGLNIQYYVTVNFFGFQKIAEALGGIEVDITEAEMNEINKKLLNQYRIANAIGEEAPTIENDYLQVYGANTHLTGHQTLAYARVRSIDSDFSRAERQRTVLIKLMEKLKGKGLADIILLINSLSSNVTTNMDLNTVAQIAYNVLNNGISDVETFRVPVNNTYTEERRNDQAMLYDCDWEANRLQLYNFIYE